MKIYLVGGAVRDMLMGKEPSDRDWVVVGSTPQEMLDLGYEQVDAAFPVFLHPQTGEEYALARTEKKTGPGYHGFETYVDQTVSLVDDLARRDFTMNAIAYDPDAETFIDPFGGIDDIRKCTLRHVGPTFAEDPLRVVRMARFLARFTSFQVADETFTLAKMMVCDGQLNELAWERFGAEVVKVLDTCSPDGCFTFFDVLDKLKVHHHVAFFDKMALKMGHLMEAARVASKVKREIVGSMRPVVVAGLVFTDPARAMHIGGSLAADLVKAVQHLDTGQAGPEHLYDLLQLAGAWRNSPTWSLLVTAVQVGQALGRPFPYFWTQLVQAEATTTTYGSIGASLAAKGLKGAQIGAAIKDARMFALRQMDLSDS